MNFILKDFQNDAKNKMLEFMDLKKKELVLRSPTGSGKTIILTSFIDDFCNRCLLSKSAGLEKRFEIALQFGIMIFSRILR